MIEEKTYPKLIKWQLVFIALFASLFLGLFKMDKPIWIDEGYSIYTSSYDFKFIVESLKIDTGPPLYYILLFLWMKVFGISEIAVRSLSVSFYLLSVVAVYYAALTIYKNKNIGLISCILYSLSPLAFGQGQNARMYSLLSLLAVFSMILFFKLFFDDSLTKKSLFFYILVNSLGTFTHYWYVFSLFSHFVIYWIFSNRKTWKTFLVSMVFSVLPFLLLWTKIAIGQMKDQRGKIDWMMPPNLYTLLNTVINFYSYKENLEEGILFYILIIAMVLIDINKDKIKLRAMSELKEFFLQKLNIILILFVSLSLLAPFFISQFRPIFMPTRQPILVLFGFVLILGAILEKFVYRNLLVFFLWCLLIATTLNVFNGRIDPFLYLYSSKNTAVYMLEHAEKGDYVILTNNTYHLIVYYFRLAGKEQFFTQKSFPEDLTDFFYPVLIASQVKSIINEIDTSKDIKDMKIWVIGKKDSERDKILFNELDSKLILQSKLDLQGNFHDIVYLYKRKSPSE